MRVLAIVIVSLLSNGCGPAMIAGTVSGVATERGQACGVYDECTGGTGEADGVVSFAVAGTIVGALAFALARRLHATTSSPAASQAARAAPASSPP